MILFIGFPFFYKILCLYKLTVVFFDCEQELRHICTGRLHMATIKTEYWDMQVSPKSELTLTVGV